MRNDRQRRQMVMASRPDTQCEIVRVDMKNTGTRPGISKFALGAMLGVWALAGCESILETASSNTPVNTTRETIQTDVLAPEAFSISDTALWDGRPTFGGVWLAYPDIDTPERVRITNPDSGKTVIGALYKRERQFPGPKIELSADAANALGVIAGNPTKLTIVALRRKEVEIEVEAPVITGDANARPLRRPASVVPPAPLVAAAPEVAAAVGEAAVVEAVSAVTPPLATTTPEVETTTLPPLEAEAVESSINVYIQVTTVQSQAHADEAVEKLQNAGLIAAVHNRTAGGKTLYRIVVGPATSPDALEIMLRTVHELDYKNAIKLK